MHVTSWFTEIIAYDHTTLNIPVLVRPPKSSSVGPGQYLDWRQLGNTGCCRLFAKWKYVSRFFHLPFTHFFFHLPLPHPHLFELIFLLFSCIQAFHFSFQAINSPCLAFNLTLTATRLVKQITIERSALSLLLSKKQRVEDWKRKWKMENLKERLQGITKLYCL